MICMPSIKLDCLRVVLAINLSLRFLCPKAKMIGLTATAEPTQRRKIVKVCFGASSKVIHDSTDRPNIKITSN